MTGIDSQVDYEAQPSLRRDALAAALLPVLIHRLGNTAQLLTGLRALVDSPPTPATDALLHRRQPDLADAHTDVEELGWLLGVLASASGENLLLGRHLPKGLASMIDLVRHTLRRDGRELPGAQARLPELAPNVLDGWQLPWAIGSVLWAAGQRVMAPDWKLQAGEGRLRLSVSCAAKARASGCNGMTLEEVGRIACATLGPAASLECSEESFALSFPQEWVEPVPPAAAE